MSCVRACWSICCCCCCCCKPGKPANIIKRVHCSELRLRDALFKFLCSAYPASIAALRNSTPAAAAAAAAHNGSSAARSMSVLPLLMSAYKDGQLVGECTGPAATFSISPMQLAQLAVQGKSSA
jgi:hypothetical protein